MGGRVGVCGPYVSASPRRALCARRGVCFMPLFFSSPLRCPASGVAGRGAVGAAMEVQCAFCRGREGCASVGGDACGRHPLASPAGVCGNIRPPPPLLMGWVGGGRGLTPGCGRSHALAPVCGWVAVGEGGGSALPSPLSPRGGDVFLSWDTCDADWLMYHIVCPRSSPMTVSFDNPTENVHQLLQRGCCIGSNPSSTHHHVGDRR